MDELLETLRAAAEPTRLRLVALCARSELTVTELTQILGQSQPRVSRHLKLLCDAGDAVLVPGGAELLTASRRKRSCAPVPPPRGRYAPSGCSTQAVGSSR